MSAQPISKRRKARKLATHHHEIPICDWETMENEVSSLQQHEARNVVFISQVIDVRLQENTLSLEMKLLELRCRSSVILGVE